MKGETAPGDRAVGLLAVASAIAVANAYYIQRLLVEAGGALSIPSGLVAILPGLSQIGLACGLAFLLPLGDIISARRLHLTVDPVQTAHPLAEGESYSGQNERSLHWSG